MTGLSPSLASPSRGLGPGPPLRTLLRTTIRTTEAPDSKAGLFPIRSPILRESLLPEPVGRGFKGITDSHLDQPRARGAWEASIGPATTTHSVIEA
ncbi:hypothetical protein CQW23_33493 [Capsicum baccatum]|uniref:Uncharacterized protein n=1 Tax=Capsicum baccatum TaxID=33114 RepID=A0A2G2V1M0_CAPBA|nr:hypothetical protein CQW23_33493 [Capsicum baccatum]